MFPIKDHTVNILSFAGQIVCVTLYSVTEAQRTHKNK